MDQNPYRPPDADLFAPESAGGGGGGIDLGDNWDPIEALSIAWRLFTENLGLMLGVVGITFGVSIVFAGITQVMSLGLGLSGDENLAQFAPLVTLPVQVVGGLINFFLALGAARIYLALARGQQAELGLMFSGAPYFLSAFGAAIIVGFATFFGMLLLLVPGVIAALGLMFYKLLVLDGTAAIDAISRSWEITDGHKVKLLIWALVLGGVMLVGGCLTCGIGFFVAAPLAGLSQAIIYQHLLNRAQG